MTDAAATILLCQAGTLICGLQLQGVVETMRRLPIEPLSGTPEFLLGVSVVRGSPTPVVDLARLLGEQGETRASRFVLVNAGGRHVALSVAEVMGLRAFDVTSLSALPPLLEGARAEFVSAIGVLDAHLLLVLESARILPKSIWAELQLGVGA